MRNTGAINMASDGATLPVRIRDKSGTVISEGVTGRDIEVEAGTYLVGTVLPNGCEVLSETLVDVVAGKTVSAPRPSLAQDLSSGLVGDAVSAPFPAAGGSAEELTARRWRGDWLAFCNPENPIESLKAGAFVGEPITLQLGRSVPIERQAGTDDLLVIAHAGKVTVHVLPLDRCIFGREATGESAGIAVELRLEADRPQLKYTSPVDAATNSFIEYVDHALLSESRAISADFIERGQDAMESERSSLLCAVLSAYVLLRANQLDGLDRWTERMIELAPELPDAYALRAETLARMGDHNGSVKALRAGLDKGCPTFRSGLSYSLERLRLYIDVHGEKNAFNLSKTDFARFKARKAQIERAAIRLDTTALFTTFS